VQGSEAAIPLQGRVRRLQQVDQVTVVTTAQELQEAVVAGKPHIEIQDHLDLTSLELSNGPGLLGKIPSTTKSIRVRWQLHFSMQCLT
jgi:hypothetical protein